MSVYSENESQESLNEEMNDLALGAQAAGSSHGFSTALETLETIHDVQTHQPSSIQETTRKPGKSLVIPPQIGTILAATVSTAQVTNVSGGEFSGAHFGDKVENKDYHLTRKDYVHTGDIHQTINYVVQSDMQEEKEETVEGEVQLSDSITMFESTPISQKIFKGVLKSKTIGPRHLAIKFLPYNEQTLQEAKILLRLSSHPNVVSIIHSDVSKHGPFNYIYIAMELCNEQNLHDYVSENNFAFDPQLSIFQARQLLEGLNYIHENNIIHRDLKPHNVLFSADKKTLKIADFGISKPMTRGRTMTNVTNARAGTDGYRAPETYNSNELSQRADIYSMGLVLYFLWSNGLHAFGDDPDSWNYNIKKNKNRDLSQLLVPEVVTGLLEEFLQFDSRLRPTAKQILTHNVFSISVNDFKETSPKAPFAPRIPNPVMNRQATDTTSSLTVTSPIPSDARITPPFMSTDEDGEAKTLEKIILLREKAEHHLKHNQYSSARGYLEHLIEIQEDPWDQFETLKQVAECHIMRNEQFQVEINRMISTCQKLGLSPADVKITASKHLEDSDLIHSYIMYLCASKMYKADNSANNALSGISKCISDLDSIIQKTKRPRLRGIASGYMIPSMHEMLADFREISDGSDNDKLEKEADCLNDIGLGHRRLSQYHDALNAFEEGIKLMRDTMGEYATKYRTLGFLMHNAGNTCDDLGRYAEAAEYLQHSVEAKEKAEDFSSEEDRKESLEGTKTILMRVQKQKIKITGQPSTSMLKNRTADEVPSRTATNPEANNHEGRHKKPSTLATAPSTGASDAPARSSTSNEKEPKTIDEIISLKEKANRFLKYNQYTSACRVLQKLFELQEDPWEQCETLQQIAECQIMCNQPYVDEMNKILTACQSLGLSPSDMKITASKYLEDSEFVRSYVMFVCASKVYKANSSPTEASSGIRSCIWTVDSIIENMKQPRLRGIATSYLIPSMHQMLSELQKIEGLSDNTRAFDEAACFNNIGLSHHRLDQNAEAVKAYDEGIKVMQVNLGANANEFKIFGFLLHNAGNALDDLGKYAEAAEYFRQAVVAKEDADDFDNETKKKENIDGTKSALNKTEKKIQTIRHTSMEQKADNQRKNLSSSQNIPFETRTLFDFWPFAKTRKSRETEV